MSPSALQSFTEAIIPNPFLAIPTLTFVMFIVRILAERVISKKLGGMWGLKSKKILFKFCESCYYFMYYGSAFLIGAFITLPKDWAWNTKECWAGYPFEIEENNISVYYLMQTGHYLSALIFIVFLRHQREKHKDKYVLLSHHVVALALIGLSSLFGFQRIGMLVFLVHDISDIFLEFTKMVTYLGYAAIKNGTFALFALLFFVSRLVIFPFHIIKSSLTETYDTIPKVRNGAIAYLVFNDLLLILQCFHIYWMYLIVMMIINALRKGDVEKDIRSSGEEEDDMKEE